MNQFPKFLQIEDMKLPIALERSQRKSLSIQITGDMQLLIKAPLLMPEKEISRFLQRKQFWIYKQAKRMEEVQKNRIYRSAEEIRRLKEQARDLLTARSEFYAKQIGVCYNRIRIGSQKTRWGSCSSKGTISYNWHLVLMPERIVDYVVVHELCHLLEMNHSKRFWEKVAAVIPEYAECRRWLKVNGNLYQDYE